MCFCRGLERGAAEAAQCGIAHRDHRRRTRQSVDDRKLADDVASADEGKDALVAGVRNHRDLEESILDAIAVVVGITGQDKVLPAASRTCLALANSSVERRPGKSDSR